MEMVMLQVVALLFKVSALVYPSIATGSAASPDGVLSHFYITAKFMSTASAPMPQINAPGLVASEPQSLKALPPSTWSSPLPTSVSVLSPSSFLSPNSFLGQPQALPAEAPEKSGYPIASPPSIESKTTAWPVAAAGGNSVSTARSPLEAPNAGKYPWLDSHPVHSPVKRHHHHQKVGPAHVVQAVPPISGFSSSSSPFLPPVFAPSDNSRPAISPVSDHAKRPLEPPLQSLPPPPSQTDCMPLICSEPRTYGPSEAPCACVLPMQVGLRLSVALYTFFPMVSELASEIAMGAFVKRSQVRIMGANTSGDDPEKTVVLIDLLPVGERIDDATAYVIFKRFWSKKVDIKSSLFGGYDVLYVRYPGLPRSPPSPPYTLGIIASKPYPGSDNNARNMEPFGVDVRGTQHKHGLRGITVAIIVMSCSLALIVSCAIAWIFLFRYRFSVFESDPAAVTTVHSTAKSSVSIGSGPSSPSFSLGSSIAAYTGSARKFSSREIERATDFFNESRILGEGGFGRVYRGTLEDGTIAAIKILKRFDQQSSREFLAEFEMLSRLHHRNLVKLIGICVEDRIHCLIYELIPNGSVESHLHGIHKEISPLDWSARIKIALGAARALAYLHEDSSPRVIHRDFKASNILLEDDFSPKVSDFGLARTAFDEENRHISTRVMGTFGYVAPEYAMTGHLLVQSDVYSYGVVLLELLSGRKPVDMSRPSGEENLVSWARPLLTSREGLEAMIDESLGPDFPFDGIAKVAAIASMCVQPEVSNRPFMGEVVQALKLVCNEEEDNKQQAQPCSPPPPQLSPSSEYYGYNYLVELERDLSTSELLRGGSEEEEEEGSGGEEGGFRRRYYSSSGPLSGGKTKGVWKAMRQFKRSRSEHGTPLKLWPTSH